jgi:bifunctional non-homologous end joining protein LigD
VESIVKLGVQDAIIDGEIVALDEQGRSSFQLLQGFDMGAERPHIIFQAFDLLQLNGTDLKSLPIEERKAKLAEWQSFST